MLTQDQFNQLAGQVPEENRAAYLTALNNAMTEFEINTNLRISAFVAQTLHESQGYSRLVENLNYRAAGLMATWSHRFPTLAFAQQYEHNPEKIANHVYSSRNGNGDEASGDGFTYRGRGAIQITGRANYEAAGTALGIDLVAQPELLESPDQAFRAAAWWWKSHGLNELADAERFKKITMTINGGTTGELEREQLYAKVKGMLGS